jgi:ATP-dependent Lhr-like helicase
MCIDGLIRRARSGELPDHTHGIYCSPLKAVSNDILRTVGRPGGIPRANAERGVAPAHRVGLRTSGVDRQRISERPHIL